MLAAIDVGSNTVRLLLGHATAAGVEPFHYERRITRLKGKATAAGLADDAMDRTLAALREFAALIARHAPVACRAVGTAALRDAANASVFLGRVAAETGLAIEIIPGAEEARLAAAGVLAALDPVPPACLIVDIGGGSTEFVLLAGGEILLETSVPLGVVSLAEGGGSAERSAVISAGLDPVFALLGRSWPHALADLALVGTAGTVTTLAAMQLEMTSYDWRRVNNLHIPLADLERLRRKLQALAPAARESLPGMEKGRGDLILPGIAIIQAVATRLGVSSLTVSDFGLLEGVLRDLGQRRDRAND